MKVTSAVSPIGRGDFNTLAQNATRTKGRMVDLPGIVRGLGADLSKHNQFIAWSEKKKINRAVIFKLIDIAKEEGDLRSLKSYWNSLMCLHQLTTDGKRLYGKYCKTRICSICNGIRKAELINKYLPIVEEWPQPYFLTLTMKAASASELSQRIDQICSLFERIIKKHKMRFRRGKGVKLYGLKSLECNFNPKSKTYNPHIHLLVPSFEITKIIFDEWLMEGVRIFGETFVNRYAQSYKLVWSRKKKMVELIKYNTKIFTDPDVKKFRGDGKRSPMIYAAAIHTILKAMENRRVFDRFGFNLPKATKARRTKMLTEGYKEWEYYPAVSDWVEKEGACTLTNYQPQPDLTLVLDKNIDTGLK